jgi:YHS domain-containing protein
MDMARDPVCEMEIDPRKANYQTTYQGKTYYFDTADCKRDFDTNPKKYVKADMMGKDRGEHQMGRDR